MVNTRRSRGDRRGGDGEQPPDPLQVILNRLNEQQTVLNQLVQERNETRAKQEEEARIHIEVQPEQNLANQDPPIPLENPPEAFHVVISRFNKHHPPSFHGHIDVVQAENWIKSLEKNI